MQEEILARLDALAAQLGVATEHLWSVLIAQASIEAITQIAITLLIWVVCGIAIFLAPRFWRKSTTATDPKTSMEDGFEVGAQISGIIGALTGFLATIMTILTTKLAMTALLNPEYWALNEILTIFK